MVGVEFHHDSAVPEGVYLTSHLAHLLLRLRVAHDTLDLRKGKERKGKERKEKERKEKRREEQGGGGGDSSSFLEVTVHIG